MSFKNPIFNATIIVVVLALIGVGLYFLVEYFKKREGYGAVPEAFVYRGNYHGFDYGFGTNIIQTDWSRGAFFQNYLPLNTGMYDDSCNWCPRNIIRR